MWVVIPVATCFFYFTNYNKYGILKLVLNRTNLKKINKRIGIYAKIRWFSNNKIKTIT